MKRGIIGTLTLFLVLCTAFIIAAAAGGIEKPLIAGGGRYETTVEHGTTVGTIEVSNDAVNLYVKYNILAATGDWYINETHLAVATSLDDIPQTKNGNPVPGHFEYQDKFELGVKDYTYTIPLASLGESTEIYIAAQAVVTNMAEIVYVDPTTGENFYRVETAWGEGTSFPGNNWAMYFTYEVQGVEGNTG